MSSVFVAQTVSLRLMGHNLTDCATNTLPIIKNTRDEFPRTLFMELTLYYSVSHKYFINIRMQAR